MHFLHFASSHDRLMPTRGNRRRAPSGSGSVYQETTRRKRVDGTELVTTRWVAAITLPNGQRKRFRAATEREALAKLKTMFSEQAQGAVLTTARQTVGEYLEWWLENSLRGKPTSLMTYTTIVRSHLLPTVGRHQLTQLQPEHVERMMADLKSRGLSPARINSVRATLQQALGVALRRRRVPLNAAALVDPYRVEHAEIEPLEPAECQRWFAVLRGERLGALYVLAMATGLRQGELLGLRWEDVDLEHARITVRQQMAIFADTDGKLRPQPQSPKTKRSRRSAPLPSFVIEALETHREQQALIRKVVGPDWQEFNLVFPNRYGGAMNASTLRQSYHGSLKRAGLPDRRFHDLRHIYASLLMALGVHPFVAAQLLGHSQNRMTEHYSHVVEGSLRAAADRLDALFQGAENPTAPPTTPPSETVRTDAC